MINSKGVTEADSGPLLPEDEGSTSLAVPSVRNTNVLILLQAAIQDPTFHLVVISL